MYNTQYPSTVPKLIDTGLNHFLTLLWGEDADDDYSLTFITGNANRQIQIDANAKISQDYTSAGSPTFAACSLGTGELTAGSINRASGVLTLEIGGVSKVSVAAAAVTLSGNLIIPNTGYIGSVSATSAIQIEADGDVVLSNNLIVTGTSLLIANEGYLGCVSYTTALQIESDGDIVIVEDLSVAGIITGVIGPAADIELGDSTPRILKPAVTKKMDLGSAALKYRNAYVENLFVEDDLTCDGEIKGSRQVFQYCGRYVIVSSSQYMWFTDGIQFVNGLGWVMNRPGSLVGHGVVTYISTATSGYVEFRPYRNNAGYGSNLYLQFNSTDGTGLKKKYATTGRGIFPFVAGDIIQAYAYENGTMAWYETCGWIEVVFDT